MNIWKTVSDWKTIIGYLILHVQWVTGNPMLWGALKVVMADPSSQNIANLIAQLILAIGVADRIRKNLLKP